MKQNPISKLVKYDEYIRAVLAFLLFIAVIAFLMEIVYVGVKLTTP